MAAFVIWHGAGLSCKEKSGWLNCLGAECHGGRYCLSHCTQWADVIFLLSMWCRFCRYLSDVTTWSY